MTPDPFAERYGPVAFVAGAASQVGQAFAEELAARGLDLIVTARRTARLEELAEKLKEKHGTTTRIVAADLADPGGTDKVLAVCEGQDIGLVVSNGGFSTKGAFERGDAATMAEMLMVNCNAPMQLAHGLIPRLKSRGVVDKGAGLVLVSSVEGLIGHPYSAAYAATMALVNALGEALWAELRTHGVEVLTCCHDAADEEDVAGAGITDIVRDRMLSPRECVMLALDNIAEGPTFIPSKANRERFENLAAQPRRGTLIELEQARRMMA